MFSAQLYFHPVDDIPTWIVATVFAMPLLVGLTIYFYRTRHAKTWRKGIFPQSLKPTEENTLEAYLAIGAKLMLIEYNSNREKIQYINAYFNKYFKFSNYNFGDSLLFSIRHPIQIHTVLQWLMTHYSSASERLNIVYFLTGLALINGKMKKGELAFLVDVCNQLEIDTKELERIIHIYLQYYKEKEGTENKGRSEGRTDGGYYCEILGVTHLTPFEEIKKKYRSLVKLHHPDKFENASESQRKLAEEKFIQIQAAYEYLTKKGDQS